MFDLNKIKKKNICIIGLMGSGKSIIGKDLSEYLNLKFYDTDKEIELKTNKTISKIFEEQGDEDKDGNKGDLVIVIKCIEMENYKIINFVIGGSWGHGQKIKNHAKIIMSFGKMTWSHLTARIMMIEQLYRVETIFNNHPYHK